MQVIHLYNNSYMIAMINTVSGRHATFAMPGTIKIVIREGDVHTVSEEDLELFYNKRDGNGVNHWFPVVCNAVLR